MTNPEGNPYSGKVYWSKLLFISFQALFLGIFVGIFTIKVFDEFLSFSSGEALEIGVLAGIFFAVCFFVYSKAQKTPIASNGEESLSLSLNVLSIQKIISAVGALSLGISAAIVAGQTIVNATSSSDLLTVRMPATQAYEKLLEKQAELIHESQRVLPDSNVEALKLAMGQTTAALLRIEESGMLAVESSRTDSGQPIDGGFLFSFFSSLFVRVGTIIILLFLFSVVIREYRRVDKRHSEMQQILLATKLQLEGVDMVALEKSRAALRVDDTPKETENDAADVQFAEKFVRDVSAPLKELSETIRSIGSKNGPEV